MDNKEDTPISPEAQKMLDEHYKKRAELEKTEEQMHFSYGLEATLTQKEREANEILKNLREEVANNEYMNRTIHNYFENKKIMETSKLFKLLNAMPKGGIHHIHTTAAIPIEAYLQATYDDRVYYSERDQLFKVYPKH